MKDDVAICFVGDFRYLYKYFNNMYLNVRHIGEYKGDILILTSIFCPTFLIKQIRKKNKVKVLRFRKINFSKKAKFTMKTLNTDPDPNRYITKKFQWHKLNLFDLRLKKWKSIFYIDLNMNIHFPLEPILINRPNKLILARADSYPEYDWKLSSQFDKSNQLYKELNKKFNLSITNYFQTGIMYIDTEIIQKNTKKEIVELANEYPISKTNEQGILNLYFIFIKNHYQELVAESEGFITYFYWKIKDKSVIITKAATEKIK